MRMTTVLNKWIRLHELQAPGVKLHLENREPWIEVVLRHGCCR